MLMDRSQRRKLDEDDKLLMMTRKKDLLNKIRKEYADYVDRNK
ncbi:hypothetical protein EV05_1821 [Prochlorococcus sp. MIT 0601]|nr:hypothetical protein EV05_1821 [Prochlorococcus sp. MIT 0601]